MPDLAVLAWNAVFLYSMNKLYGKTVTIISDRIQEIKHGNHIHVARCLGVHGA